MYINTNEKIFLSKCQIITPEGISYPSRGLAASGSLVIRRGGPWEPRRGYGRISQICRID